MTTNGSSSSSLHLPRQESLGGSSSANIAPSTYGSGYTHVANGSHDDLSGRSVPEQMEVLQKKLETAKKIEVGAETMLGLEEMQQSRALRDEVQLELLSARKQIEEVQRQITRLNQTRPPPRKKSSSSTTGRRPSSSKDDRDDHDSTQIALQNASVIVRSLLNMGRPGSSPVLSTQPLSSNGAPINQDVQLDRNRTEYMNRLTTAMQRNMRIRYELDHAEVIHSVLPGLSDHSSKECRAAAYRVLRHTLVDTESVQRLRSQHIDWYLIKSLARDNKHAIEKEQALKLIRSFVEIGSDAAVPSRTAGSGTIPVSEAVMRAVIAIAEHPEDPFKNICIQTLIEILLVDIDLTARSGGIRTLLHILADGLPDLAPLLNLAFLHIIDSPRTRVYIDPGDDFEIVLSGVTDAFGKGVDYAEKMRASLRIIASIFRTWSGLLYLCLYDMAAVKSLVGVLRIPELDTRELILDFFFDLFNIKTPKWYQPFIDGRRLSMYRRSGVPIEKNEPLPQRPGDAFKMRDQYIALMLLVFTKAGLLDALTCMLEETTAGTNLSRRAVLLMGEVMHLANRLLPSQMAATIQSIGRVFELASDQTSATHRIVGTNALSSLDSFNRHRTRLAPSSVKPTRLRSDSVEDPVRRGQRQVEQVRIKIGMQMDDKTFQQTLLETNVILTKDHTKWNLDVLQDVIEGPLLNHKRIEEAIKVSKFMRKLMSFFHPFSHRFADMPRRGNARWAKLANTLLSTLLASPEGQKYLLNEDPLVKEIVKGFAQLDPHNSVTQTDPLFSKKRVEETLSCSYLELLGIFSKSKEGIEILEKFKVFTAFYHLTELKDRHDLMTPIIETLDYSIDGHPRVVLSKALTSSYVPIRLFATNHLGRLIRKSTTPIIWQLRLLVTQMYDPETAVCETAARFLEEVCEDIEALQVVVEMNPTFEHLGETAHPLLLKAMSTSIGFRSLHDAGYIDREMDNWFHERNETFVVQMEVFLSKAFAASAPERDMESMPEEIVPPHFYGELAKTELGCAVLGEKGHFTEFAMFIRQYGQETEDAELVLKLKSILWAVGNVGATEGGLPFLEDEDIIPDLIRIAEESRILSVRGTCFFVLGLISSTIQGAEILSDFGWDATLSPLGLPLGICVPADVSKFTMIEPWSVKEFTPSERPSPPTDEREIEFMTAIYNLSNTVIANNASRSLAKMKVKPEYRPVFSSYTMLYRALHIISTSKYKQPVRRYILDLFNLHFDQTTMLQIAAVSRQLYAATTPKPSRIADPRAFSIVGHRRHVVPDEDSDSSGDELGPPPVIAPQKVVRTLRPMSRIVGFEEGGARAW